MEGFEGTARDLSQVEVNSPRARCALTCSTASASGSGQVIWVMLVVSASYLPGEEVNVFNRTRAETQQPVFDCFHKGCSADVVCFTNSVLAAILTRSVRCSESVTAEVQLSVGSVVMAKGVQMPCGAGP